MIAGRQYSAWRITVAAFRLEPKPSDATLDLLQGDSKQHDLSSCASAFSSRYLHEQWNHAHDNRYLILLCMIISASSTEYGVNHRKNRWSHLHPISHTPYPKSLYSQRTIIKQADIFEATYSDSFVYPSDLESIPPSCDYSHGLEKNILFCSSSPLGDNLSFWRLLIPTFLDYSTWATSVFGENTVRSAGRYILTALLLRSQVLSL